MLPALSLLALVLLAAFLAAQQRLPATATVHAALEGQTMGTRYRVLLHAATLQDATDRQALAETIAGRLQVLDREIFSTYAPASELSRLNALAPGAAMTIAPDLLDVLQAARAVHDMSGGAFDITVKPLVDLWGFGASGSRQAIPPPGAISAALAATGMSRFRIDSAMATVTKAVPVTLDLSAIAKGFAVDQVARLLEDAGFRDFLVEIGGEIVVRGHRGDGNPWQVGIEVPEEGPSTLFQAIRTDGRKMAVAASGNYRNFFIHEGRRYSHAIDPATGWPVDHALASVTVVAESAMLADAWATALLVLGPEEGMKRANELQLAASFIVAGSTGFSARHSDAFVRYL